MPRTMTSDASDNVDAEDDEEYDNANDPVKEDKETEEWEGDDDDSSDDEKIESDDYCGTTASFSQ